MLDSHLIQQIVHLAYGPLGFVFVTSHQNSKFVFYWLIFCEIHIFPLLSPSVLLVSTSFLSRTHCQLSIPFLRLGTIWETNFFRWSLPQWTKLFSSCVDNIQMYFYSFL